MVQDIQAQYDLERAAVNRLAVCMQALNNAIDNTRGIRMDESSDLKTDVRLAIQADESTSICDRLLSLVGALTAAIAEAEVLEGQRSPPVNPNKPRAPLCLLSLRDYTTVQAAIELITVWGAYPCVEAGILTPIDQRVMTRTFKMDKTFVQRVAALNASVDNPAEQLDNVISHLLSLLQLSQFKPMLLPSYLSDLLACLVFRIHCMPENPPTTSRSLLNTLFETLPIRVIMSSLRGVLGQRHTNIPFKAQCGLLLSQCVLKDGGVLATIEMLLSTVDEGNTQARLHVAALISRCPKALSASDYLRAVAPQVHHLLTHSTTTKLLREVAGLITTQLILDHPLELIDETILAPLLTPLLRLVCPPDDVKAPPDEIVFISTEEQLNDCIAALKCILLGPVPPKPVFEALAPLFRPLLYMYAFARDSKSFVKDDLQQLLLLFIQQAPEAAKLLRDGVLTSPSQMPRLSLCHPSPKAPAVVFSGGGSGGVAVRVADDGKSDRVDSVVQAIVDLLGQEQLSSCDVVGELFSLLLTSYMTMKTSKKGVENSEIGTWHLLVNLTEQLGPAVLRSGESILQCLVTVLTMYVERDDEDNEDDEETTEVLSVALSMVMTIVEVGATIRSAAEENQLKQMLKPLKQLAAHPTPLLAEMASDLCLRIVAREAEEVPTPAPVTFEETLELSKQDLESPQVPLRARGLARLTKWIRRGAPLDIDLLFPLFVRHLEDNDSYVFLAAVQALAGLGDKYADKSIPMLLDAVNDKKYSLEKRIKLSEALVFTARRCGEIIPKYSQGFVYAYLHCIRKSDSQQDIVEATFRASCLSNLAEVCGLLKWSIQTYIADVVGCVKGILEIERQNTDAHTALRRGAIFLLFHMLQMMGGDIFEIVPEYMSPIYRLLKLEASTEKDPVCRYHADQSLALLDTLMRGELFQIGSRQASSSSVPSILLLN
ncbi:hypothetical protein LEN26_015769 [Aphanomyces euteiches]|nr:hypothetical protein LEN26_015769 [Aphanomyces euteiches]